MCVGDYVCPIFCYSGIILHIHFSQLLIIASGAIAVNGLIICVIYP